MKLARPDVFHPRIVFAAAPARPGGPPDDAGLVGALRSRGLHARWLPWTDPAAARADLVILREVGDHAGCRAQLSAWAAGVGQLLNPPAVLAWNLDKRYLLDLADRGVPTVETAVFAPGQVARVNAGAAVVAPAVGAGARRFERPAAAREHAARLQAAGQTVVIQPAESRRRTALVFVGGAPSHAVAAGTGVDADFGVWDVGQAALAAAAARLGVGIDEILTARAVVAGGPDGAGGAPQLLRLQLVDPVLGWTVLAADARARHQRQFALAVESALQRRGLGPLAHRRP
ncbi:hypothetical protein H7J77_14970 [Mycolicibacillus parakoreensis]|uniref:ATP-grasp domain-containing protein n=1 Tax=Mycolicibacillus parakoreensis TaxID=1069221 RepID=A0ABY3TVH0_9MYCO|nr:hypothetical protein [Mycolicibacillus parakoreensis]MCV7316835.1 hypothetical protein [Mycolicibacillus parakoreensis]ULN51197.1 hypothetical protein MIU77_09565 [Mycolicibacillus parakoreensis]HLR99040.1 hypothetical protein [Mycolicibacillus parakoreensis]